MASTILFTKGAAKWVRALPAREQAKLVGRLDQLARGGPALGRPAVDTLNGSRYTNMKELRPAGSSQRLLFAFDPRGRAVALAGGDKAAGAGQRQYRQLIKVADQRFAAHLRGSGREITWTAMRAGMRSDGRSH